ncbi:hypothetical protein [Rathayibacter sp. Leaf296]|uniref:hypothetical protein n=1 Tax=Rathayibacter sp. Leaf296 TaxID=1736327 RepID=UPI0007030E40|nr:hypothetical protein [Rathayibacter sp. Leaf296]KQQ09949.1 hypothetical protein ASF46_02230 [Rathayibacter sp. Leaf296]
MHVRSRTLLGAVALTALAALSGCTPADPAAEPTSSAGAPTSAPGATSTPSSDPATPTPTATPTAAPTAADATSLLVGPTSFSLVDDAGTELGTWAYRDGTGAVAALTEAFGSAPTESDDVPYEGYRTRNSSWPGFDFKDTEVYDAGGPESQYPEPDFLLAVNAPAVGDVAISTLSGVAVGDAAVEVRDEHPEAVQGDSLGIFDFDRTPVGVLDGTELTNSVGVLADDEITVSGIRAPFVNWGV